MDKELGIDVRNLLEKNNDIIERLVQQNRELLAENETWRRVSNSDDWIEMTAVAKALNYKGYGRNKIFDFLRNNNIVMQNNEPYQAYVDRGYFKIIEQKVDLPYGDVMINRKTVVSQKGLDFIRKALDEYFN